MKYECQMDPFALLKHQDSIEGTKSEKVQSIPSKEHPKTYHCQFRP